MSESAEYEAALRLAAMHRTDGDISRSAAGAGPALRADGAASKTRPGACPGVAAPGGRPGSDPT
ncbi:hypothetical protein ACGFMO_09345 [Streptomyces niveus]|uniref:hypothetical protein n=1 Tax=Streptomyces niveus TaxID=193462 RepID=UPI0037229EB6